IVDEILYNLRWMVTMQDPSDGGVYHKLTSLSFCGMVMPDKDNFERYVVKKSTAAALDLAATCAKAYRVLEAYDADLPGLRDSLMKTAEKAWDWAQKNPSVLFRNPEGVSTGEYGDGFVRDEFAWAAMEMTLSTGDAKKYMKDIKNEDFNFSIPAWPSVSMLGVMSYLNIPAHKDKFDADSQAFTKDNFIKLADKCLSDYEKCSYATPIVDFPWGSNSVAANQGIVLFTAYRISGNTKYIEAAEADLHYLLGRNPLDYCYVTGFGGNSVKDVHDRRCVADGIKSPIPGYLCGGPNATARGDIADSLYLYKAPAMRYCDVNGSYTTNEIAINWNSALIGLLFDVND
ncbi:MAG: glycoside hydrolase family 9 protein, partial [Bacteroidales bacterium]|nr:glycoside hydrolase family 9 protein [Bacteroidales bacterium]